MSRFLFLLTALVGIAIAVIVFAPSLIPAERFKGQIETAASKALGRTVTIGDDLTISVFPQTAFKVTNLTIANEDGFEGETLLNVQEASIGVKLLPLLSQSIEVDRFILIEPSINLIRAADGAVNWNLASKDASQPSTETEGPAAPRDLRLGNVQIEDGRATYQDLGAGRSYVAEDVNLRVILKALDEPLEVKGDLIFQGEPAAIDLVLTNLADYMAGAPANLKIDVDLAETSAGADLTLVAEDALSYSGPITFEAPDLRAFADLVGTEIADAPGFDYLSLAGDVTGDMKAMRLSGARIGFDKILAQGVMDLNWSGTKPNAGGILSTELLDLRPYLPPPSTDADGFPAWSEQSMNFAGLNNIDAEFDISADKILMNDLVFGESRLKMVVENGRMVADIPELAMYGGQGSGRIVVNARRNRPSFSGNFDMEAVEAQPLSLDLLKHDNLLGLGGFKLNFTASGSSQAAIMSSIDGNGGFDIANGALKGVNIAKIVAAADQLRTSGINPTALMSAVSTARGPREQTDFSEFLTNFTINDGVMNAPSITLNGPYVTMNGTGKVNLATQTIDLRLSPRAASTADGQGGRTLAVPVRVGGSFSQPTIAIDAEALAASALKNSLGVDVSDPAKAIQSILGGGRNDDETETSDSNLSAEDELLQKGFGLIFNQLGKSDEKEDQ